MKRKHRFIHSCVILLAFGCFTTSAALAGAQSQAMPQDRDESLTRQQMAGFTNFLDTHPEVAEALQRDPSLVNNEDFLEKHGELQQYLQQHPEVREQVSQNPNAFMRQEQQFDRRQDQSAVVHFDNFLDSHPEIAEQLRKNPALVDNQEFLKDHPALQQYLAEHPGVSQEVKENPNEFMSQERRFDRREDQPRDRDFRDRDVTRGELASMDRFMDGHPEIAEQLRKNPALVDNKEFVENHPALQQYLAEHPGVREEYKENPNAFMNQEQRFDRREDQSRDRDFRDRDVTRGELAGMDRFMDSHPEIGEQLRKNPDLVNNKEFVENHPALQQYLTDHPGVREEFKENPNAFISQEQRFDRREDSTMRRDRDVTGGELSSFNEFLGSHGNIAGELSKNPSLATNKEYLENHPELRDYLKTHPEVHEELSENPQKFLQSAQQFGTHSSVKTPSESKPK